jgi:hypothetical protein
LLVDVIEQVAVLAQPRAVADAVRAAVMQRLGDRGRAERLAGVDRAVDVVVQDQVKGVEVVLGRVVAFGAGEIERHDAASLEGDGQFGQPHRDRRRERPDAADDDARLDAEPLFAFGQPLQDGVDDRGEAQAALLMQDRAEADLDVAAVLSGEVLDQFVGGARQRLGLLHDGKRHVEGL